MNVVMAGGGTGGHVFPALAVARQLEKMFDDVRITFVGTTKGIEAKIIPREGYDLRFIRSEGLVGKNIYRTVRSLFKIVLSLYDSYSILKKVKPEVVMGVGGYSSGPVLMCARFMGIPTLIHEQNTLPGLTNRILGKFVDNVAVTYYESTKYFPGEKTFITGNPVREEIFKGDRERGYGIFSLEKGLFTVFIFGGSRGAHRINDAIIQALEHLEPFRDRIQFLHQTGNEDLQRVKDAYMSGKFRGTVIPFAHEMADAYAAADLIISRAGATSLAELTACGKAAILVPYPHAAGNHQEINAKKLWDMGAARIISDRNLDGRTLSDMIRRLLEDPDSINEMERISTSLGSREATKKVAGLIEGLVKKKAGYNNTPHPLQETGGREKTNEV